MVYGLTAPQDDHHRPTQPAAEMDRLRLESAEDGDWTEVALGQQSPDSAATAFQEGDSAALEQGYVESMRDRVVRVAEDLSELQKFYSVEGSPTRYEKLTGFFDSEITLLSDLPFASYSQDDKVDYLLLKNFLTRSQRNLELDRSRESEFAPFVEPFAVTIRGWCELRQRQEADEVFEPATLAAGLASAHDAVLQCEDHVTKHSEDYSQATGSRAARRISQLREHMREAIDFYSGYHPSFDYWVGRPWATLDAALQRLETHVRDAIIGSTASDEDDAIVGEPIGRDGLLTELEAEMIPYTPEELLRIAEHEYAWCEREMKSAAADLGFGKDGWRAALEHVKGLYEAPETYAPFVRGLVSEGVDYVTERHDLVTVPPLAAETIRMTRIPPAQQRVSPFFLGGHRLQVAYPRADMSHADKLMSLRANNRHFARATAFHEMVPGHRLQLYVGARGGRDHRSRLFSTPFFVEGWALYWEMVLWRRGDFFVDAADRVGTLFWRMHRCARITFSLSFHLGRMTARECVDLLVRRVGHERSSAEGEVRRSLDGSYPPLYQAGYMLGALQMIRLRDEVVGEDGDEDGKIGEKDFHDRVLRANVMPIEMLRALLTRQELREDFKSSWRFYGDEV